MFQFILTEVVFLSLGTIMYLAIRALPKVSDDQSGNQTSAIERLIASGIPERIDSLVNASLAKFLRKIKVLVLKIDNAITRWLSKAKAERNNGQSLQDFKDIGKSQ
ncbi:MAG: hypothetical protein HY978_01810 [Candidatus Liptonbacteria bacterium]|nr:hypothetical protein [Candidatus Liptonbacteria bacterium]